MEKYTQEQIQKAADKAVEKCGDRLNVTEYWTDGQILSVCFQAVPLIKKMKASGKPFMLLLEGNQSSGTESALTGRMGSA